MINNYWTSDEKKAIMNYTKYSKADILGFAEQGATMEIIKDLRQNLDMHTPLEHRSIVHATFKSDKTYSFNYISQIDWSYDTESMYGDDTYIVIFTVLFKNKSEIYKIYRDVKKVVIEGCGQLIPISPKSIILKNPTHFIAKSTYCSNDKFIPNMYPSIKPIFPEKPIGGSVKINHA